jgi:heat shock protein HslJ
MNDLSRTILLVTLFTMLLGATAACVPAATPVPSAATPVNEIANITWQWFSVTNRPTAVTTQVPDPQDYTIIFGDDGTVRGQADCNTFNGTYSQESGFAITLASVTTAACGDGSLDQQYLELLAAVVAGGPDGTGNLALETAGGEQRMLFENGGAALVP